MRGSLITPHGEMGTGGNAQRQYLDIPSQHSCYDDVALMWHFYDFYDILRQVVTPRTTLGHWSLHWADVTVSALF